MASIKEFLINYKYLRTISICINHLSTQRYNNLAILLTHYIKKLADMVDCKLYFLDIESTYTNADISTTIMKYFYLLTTVLETYKSTIKFEEPYLFALELARISLL